MLTSLLKKTCFPYFAVLGLFVTGCGESPSDSKLSQVPHHQCQSDAYAKKDRAYDQAAKAFAGDTAACYELMNVGEYLAVSKCIKAAEDSRKKSESEADLRLSLDLQTCNPVVMGW